MNEALDKVDEILTQADKSVKGERYYARQFKSLYAGVRQSLVVLNKARSELGNEVAYMKALDVLESFVREE